MHRGKFGHTPQQKVHPESFIFTLPLEGPDVMEALEGIANEKTMDNIEARSAAPDFGKPLLTIAHTMAGQGSWSTKPSE